MFLNSPITTAPLAVGTTAVPLTATVDAQFRAFTLCPTNGDVYLGGASVTSTNGIPIRSGQTLTLATKEIQGYFVVAGSGTVDVRFLPYRGVG